MDHAFRRSLGYRLARWRFRKRPDTVTSFTNSLSGGTRALVILPLSPSASSTASLLELLRTRYGEHNLTLVADAADRHVGTLFPRSEVISMSGDDITRLFHPSAALLKRVTARHYDVAIDLNLDFLLPSGYICKASDARVRVGFTCPGADLFYNFQIRTEGSRKAGFYDRLAACLQMF